MRRKGRAYLDDFWNWVECLNLTCFMVIMGSWGLYLSNLEGAGFHGRSRTEFGDLFSLCSRFTFAADLAAFNVVIGFMKMFKYFRFYTRFLLIWDVLSHSMAAVRPFMVVMMLIIVAFAWSGMWLFGPLVDDFHSIKLSVTALCIAMLEGFDYPPMKNAAPTAAPIFTSLWTVLSNLVLLNMFIAILSHSYSYITNRTKIQDEAERLFEMPTWMLFFRSKLPCLRLKDVDLAEMVMKMKREAAEVKELLHQLDHEKLWKHALLLIAEDQMDITVGDLMEYFPQTRMSPIDVQWSGWRPSQMPTRSSCGRPIASSCLCRRSAFLPSV